MAERGPVIEFGSLEEFADELGHHPDGGARQGVVVRVSVLRQQETQGTHGTWLASFAVHCRAVVEGQYLSATVVAAYLQMVGDRPLGPDAALSRAWDKANALGEAIKAWLAQECGAVCRPGTLHLPGVPVAMPATWAGRAGVLAKFAEEVSDDIANE